MSRIALRATENVFAMQGSSLDLAGRDTLAKNLYQGVNGLGKKEVKEEEKGIFESMFGNIFGE